MTPTPESFTRHLMLRGMRSRVGDVEGGCEMTDNRSTIRIAAEQLATLAFMLAAFAIVTIEGWWRKEGR
jgi:hypothetical protein